MLVTLGTILGARGLLLGFRTSEAIDILSYNTSTGLWNQGVLGIEGLSN